MFDFFNGFFDSSLVSNNIVACIVVAVILCALSVVLTWLYFRKFYIKDLRDKNRRLRDENKELKGKIALLENDLREAVSDREGLLKESEKLAFYDKLVKAKEYESQGDAALEQFMEVHKKAKRQGRV